MRKLLLLVVLFIFGCKMESRLCVVESPATTYARHGYARTFAGERIRFNDFMVSNKACMGDTIYIVWQGNRDGWARKYVRE